MSSTDGFIREIVLSIMSGVIPDEFLYDAEIIIAGYKTKRIRRAEIPNEMWSNREFTKAMLAHDPSLLIYLETKFPGINNDEEYILTTGLCGLLLGHMGDKIKHNRTFLIGLIKKKSTTINLNDIPHFKEDEELILAAKYAVNIAPHLLKNQVFMDKAVRRNILYMINIQCPIFEDAIYEGILNTNFIPTQVKITPSLGARVLAHDGRFLKYIKQEDRTPNLIGIALIQTKEAAQYV